MDYIVELIPGMAFIVPIAAPLPSELASIETSSGSLLQRLLPLSIENPETEVIIPLDGAELHALERLWSQIALRPHIALLTGIPGARYDVLMTQGARQLGIRSADWHTLEMAFGERTRTAQRLKDTRPDLQADKGMTETLSGAPVQDGAPRLLRPGSYEAPKARNFERDLLDDEDIG